VYSNKAEYYDLPIKYNQTRINLLVQSPKCLFAYWDISDITIKNFGSTSGNYNEAEPFLKITNITKNYSYNFPIDPFTNNYYISVKDTNCKYKVELIRKLKDKFINILMSNIVTAPRDACLGMYDEAVFRNYICLGDVKKIKLYMPNTNYKNNKQDYTDFEKCIEAPSSHSHISSGERMFL
jgi:hypothetical protein